MNIQLLNILLLITFKNIKSYLTQLKDSLQISQVRSRSRRPSLRSLVELAAGYLKITTTKGDSVHDTVTKSQCTL